MSKWALDSFAVLALLGDEAGSDEVANLLREAQQGAAQVLMTWVNFGEVVYIVERRWGRERLFQVLAMVEATGIAMVTVDRELALTAAHLKANYPLAYADTFAAALAMQTQAVLVTGDPEFKLLEPILAIHWLPEKNKTAK